MLAKAALPLISLLVLMAILIASGFFIKKEDSNQMPEQNNPAQLRTALVFGAIYTMVILATAAAKDHFVIAVYM